jgi:gas vesicle protein
MARQNDGVQFFTGLVIGGLAGAGLTLLLAPQSGEETRNQIKAKSFELKDGAVEGLTEAGHRAQAQATVWQEKGQEMTKAVNQGKDNIVRAVGQSKDSVVEAVGSN